MAEGRGEEAQQIEGWQQDDRAQGPGKPSPEGRGAGTPGAPRRATVRGRSGGGAGRGRSLDRHASRGPRARRGGSSPGAAAAASAGGSPPKGDRGPESLPPPRGPVPGRPCCRWVRRAAPGSGREARARTPTRSRPSPSWSNPTRSGRRPPRPARPPRSPPRGPGATPAPGCNPRRGRPRHRRSPVASPAAARPRGRGAAPKPGARPRETPAGRAQPLRLHSTRPPPLRGAARVWWRSAPRVAPIVPRFWYAGTSTETLSPETAGVAPLIAADRIAALRLPMSEPAPLFCTIVAKNYLARARVLARSLREHHPQSPFEVLVVDDPEGLFDPGRESFRVRVLEDLALKHRAGDGLSLRPRGALYRGEALLPPPSPGRRARAGRLPRPRRAGLCAPHGGLEAGRSSSVVLTPHLLAPTRAIPLGTPGAPGRGVQPGLRGPPGREGHARPSRLVGGALPDPLPRGSRAGPLRGPAVDGPGSGIRGPDSRAPASGLQRRKVEPRGAPALRPRRKPPGGRRAPRLRSLERARPLTTQPTRAFQ